MRISEIPTTSTYSDLASVQRVQKLPRCTLKWRQGQLLVSLAPCDKHPHLPSLKSEKCLVECLKHSPVRLIRMVPELGEESLKFWADACEQANKAVFIGIPCTDKLPSKCRPRSWWLKRLIEWSVTVSLLLALSPLILGLVCLMRFQSSEPIFCWQWCIGERGKLFRLLKFRPKLVKTQTLHRQLIGNQKSLQKREDELLITPLERLIQKCSLDEMPQLFNVLRGDMSLVGPRPYTLNDAIRISPEGRQQLNALPGIIGAKQEEVFSNLLDLDAANHCNLEYLRSWSLWQDLKILLLTIPKVISGFGSY